MNKIFEKEFENGYFQIFNDKPTIKNIVEVDQIHGDQISTSTNLTTADGIMLTSIELSSHTLALKTADCLPILYIGPKHVALIHAGWRGLQLGIHIQKKLQQEKFESIFIGPSISAENFEVTEEFRDHFPESSCFSTQSGKLTFNLQEYALIQLRECFPLAIIEASNICTFDDLNFNSYRRNSTMKRNWNIFKKKD